MYIVKYQWGSDVCYELKDTIEGCANVANLCGIIDAWKVDESNSVKKEVERVIEINTTEKELKELKRLKTKYE